MKLQYNIMKGSRECSPDFRKRKLSALDEMGYIETIILGLVVCLIYDVAKHYTLKLIKK